MLERASLLRAESEAAAALQQRGELALEINGVQSNVLLALCCLDVCVLSQG